MLPCRTKIFTAEGGIRALGATRRRIDRTLRWMSSTSVTAGPASPQWHQAVQKLRAEGAVMPGADEYRLLCDARENLESGREYLGGQIKRVQVGEGKNAALYTAWALWGLDVSPMFVLGGKDGSLEGFLSPAFIIIDDRFASRYTELSRLAQDLSADVLRRLTTSVTHRYPGPIYLTKARVFDAVAGTMGDPTTVVVFGDEIVGVRSDPPPAGATVIDCGGGTILPGLHDEHAHSSDTRGPMMQRSLARAIPATRMISS